MDNKIEKKSWFDRLFSLDEMKTSSLVLCLLTSLGFGIFFCFDKGDIPQNLEVVILALVGGISGVSAFNLLSNNNNNQYSNQYGSNQYQQPYQSQQMSQNGMSGTNDSMINQTNPSMSDPPVGQIPIVNSQNTGTNNPV